MLLFLTVLKPVRKPRKKFPLIDNWSVNETKHVYNSMLQSRTGKHGPNTRYVHNDLFCFGLFIASLNAVGIVLWSLNFWSPLDLSRKKYAMPRLKSCFLEQLISWTGQSKSSLYTCSVWMYICVREQISYFPANNFT